VVARVRKNLIIGQFLSSSLFTIVNLFHFLRPNHTYDYAFAYGLPFTFYRTRAWVTPGHFVWMGMAEDFLVVLAFGLTIAWILDWSSQKA
jgi:hypothetical protein